MKKKLLSERFNLTERQPGHLSGYVLGKKKRQKRVRCSRVGCSELTDKKFRLWVAGWQSSRLQFGESFYVDAYLCQKHRGE